MRLLRDPAALAAGVAAAVAALAAWAVPSVRGDLFLALAGGRDVLQGKLGHPDTWAFTTGGAVWVHPGWGSDTLLALVQRGLGDPGLPVLKGLLLVCATAVVVAAVRARGAGIRAGLLAAALALAASPDGLPLGPGLVVLVLAPALLWVLYRSGDRPGWIGVAPLLVWAWANAGGMVLAGLAVLVLWTLCQLAAWAVRRTEAGRVGRPAAATAVAFVLAAFANPFGLGSLFQPLMVARSAVWREMAGWTPLLAKGDAVAELPWMFLAFVVLVAVPLMVRSVWHPARGRFSALLLFDLLLAAAALGMALAARGLVPLAAFLLAPLLAENLRWLLRSEQQRMPVFAAAAVLLVAVGLQDSRLVSYYAPDNPRYPRETLLERMAAERTRFPTGAAEFLHANNIRCRAFHDPRWEGYLHWKAPELQLFMGRRGAGIYPDSLGAAARSIVSGATPATDLRERGIPLAVIPLDVDYGAFTKWLLLDPDATWAYIYCDRYVAVLADASDSLGRNLVDRAAAGNLVYADPAVAALSRGMCLSCPAVAGAPAEAADALKTAVRIRPFEFAYKLLIDRAEKAGAGGRDVIHFLELQRQALEARDADTAEGLQIWKSRENVARLLLHRYGPETQDAERKLMLESLSRSGKAIRSLSSN